MKTNERIISKIPSIYTSISIDNMPGKYDNRIFVGGNYNLQFAIVLEIKRDIREINGSFTPILAIDFEIPKGRELGYCLRLLHNCRFAIFEVTSPSGQLIEIEKAKEYGTKCLLVYNTLNLDSDYKPITRMIDIRERAKGYRSLDDLRIIILKQLVQWSRAIKI